MVSKDLDIPALNAPSLVNFSSLVSSLNLFLEEHLIQQSSSPISSHAPTEKATLTSQNENTSLLSARPPYPYKQPENNNLEHEIQIILSLNQV